MAKFLLKTQNSKFHRGFPEATGNLWKPFPTPCCLCTHVLLQNVAVESLTTTVEKMSIDDGSEKV